MRRKGELVLQELDDQAEQCVEMVWWTGGEIGGGLVGEEDIRI